MKAASCLLLLSLLRAQAMADPPPGPRVDYRDPPRSYQSTRLGPWQVFVEQELMDQDPALAQRALARMRSKLGAVAGSLPAPALEALKELPIYLLYGPKASGGGRNNGAEYFRRGAPDHREELDPRWRNCVVIYSAENYVRITELWSVKVLAHEFAHAYHLTRLKENQPEIVAAYRHAMAQGLYSRVRDVNGKILERTHGTRNPLEYFAELSAIYFVGGNYYPYNRKGLRAYDPQGCAMIEKMWRVSAR